jgi:uncharacterized protein (TIGR02246 family)
MKTKNCLFVLVFFSFTAFADIANDVRCHEIAFSQSAENRDAAAFTSLLDADARFVGNSVRRGKTEITAAWSAFFADDGPAMKWRPQFVEVLEDGKLALTRGPYRMITQDDAGQAVEHWGTFNSVWRKQDDGTWKVVFDAGNNAAEPPSAEIQVLIDQEVECP